jgi:hypothetical protein
MGDVIQMTASGFALADATFGSTSPPSTNTNGNAVTGTGGLAKIGGVTQPSFTTSIKSEVNTISGTGGLAQ